MSHWISINGSEVCVQSRSLPHRLGRVLTWLLINNANYNAEKSRSAWIWQEQVRLSEVCWAKSHNVHRAAWPSHFKSYFCSVQRLKAECALTASLWSRLLPDTVVCPPAAFLDFAEQWKGVKSAYPCVLLTFFVATLSACLRVKCRAAHTV